MYFKLGADPEVFIKHPDGHIISAEGIVPGTKEEPYKVPYGAVQVDGMAAEFNIKPASTPEQFDKHIVSVVKSLEKIIQKEVPGATLSCQSVAHFPLKYFNNLSNESKILGCDPDFNAYTGEANPDPSEIIKKTDLKGPFRTGSGHLHISWFNPSSNYWETLNETDHFNECKEIVKFLERNTGNCWKILDNDHNFRTKLYGQQGTFRPKHYGLEWRSPTNKWLMTPTTRKTLFKTIHNLFTILTCNFTQQGSIKKYQKITNKPPIRRLYYQLLNNLLQESEYTKANERIIHE